MAMDFIGLSVGMGYTDETVIGGGALKGKNCVVSNIEEVADGVNVTFQWTLDDGTVKTETTFIPRGTQGEAGVAGKSAYEIWLEAGNTGTEEDFLNSLKGEQGEDGFSPVVTVTDIEGGHNVAIEDANGVQNFEVLDGKDAEQKIYTTIGDLGLTAPVTVGDIYNAMDDKTIAMIACEGTNYHITDIPGYYGILTIKRARVGRFSIEFQSSSGVSATDVKRWIGTLKGADGTELTWKLVSTQSTYVALSDMELTAEATVQDVIDALPKGGSALLGVKEFTNYQTIFPYEEENDQFAGVHIVKGIADGSNMYARWFRKDGAKEAIAKFNINTNKFDGWEKVAIRTITTLAELGLTSSATVDDVHDKLVVGQMAILQVRAFDNYQTLFPYADSNDQYARIEIQKGKSTTHSRIFWWRKDGSKFAVGNINSNNKLAGWNEYTLRSYVDNKIADLQAQIDALKS